MKSMKIPRSIRILGPMPELNMKKWNERWSNQMVKICIRTPPLVFTVGYYSMRVWGISWHSNSKMHNVEGNMFYLAERSSYLICMFASLRTDFGYMKWKQILVAAHSECNSDLTDRIYVLGPDRSRMAQSPFWWGSDACIALVPNSHPQINLT